MSDPLHPWQSPLEDYEYESVLPTVTPPPGPFNWRSLMVDPGEPTIASLYLDDMVRRLSTPTAPDAFRRKPVIEPWVWDRSFPTRDIKPFIEEQQRLVKLIAERHSIPLNLLDDSTPVPTPKPRRASTESDTMTDSNTTTEVFDHDQEVRAKSLKVAREVVSSTGSVFGGAKPAESFGTTDLLDIAEYVRGGITTTRITTRDTTIIDRHDPLNPDATDEDRLVAAYKAHGGPFKHAAIAAVDLDASDDDIRAGIKAARKAFKQLATDRGIEL